MIAPQSLPQTPDRHHIEEEGANRKRNDYYYDYYEDGDPPVQGGPFPAIKVGHSGLSNSSLLHLVTL